MTAAAVDRLVRADDAAAARLWPRLGPKVRAAYLDDRDRWIGLRRQVDAGQVLSPATLSAEHRAFAGWAHAFHIAGPHPKRTVSHVATRASASAESAPASRAAPLAAAAPAVTPTLVVAKKSAGSAGGAIAGGLVLAGLIAVAAARRKP